MAVALLKLPINTFVVVIYRNTLKPLCFLPSIWLERRVKGENV